MNLEQKLLAAIREHRDQQGDNRCWLDDEKLYSALPEGYTPPVRDSTVELENCKRFIAYRHNPDIIYVSSQAEIERLQAEIERLRLMVFAKWRTI